MKLNQHSSKIFNKNHDDFISLFELESVGATDCTLGISGGPFLEGFRWVRR